MHIRWCTPLSLLHAPVKTVFGIYVPVFFDLLFRFLEPLGFLQVQREYGAAMPLVGTCLRGRGVSFEFHRDPEPQTLEAPRSWFFLPQPPALGLQAYWHQALQSPPKPSEALQLLRQRCMPDMGISQQPGPLDALPIQKAQANGVR